MLKGAVSAASVGDHVAVLGPLLTQSGELYDVSSPTLPTIARNVANARCRTRWRRWVSRVTG